MKSLLILFYLYYNTILRLNFEDFSSFFVAFLVIKLLIQEIFKIENLDYY
jgi:hypothetical protein